MAIGTLTVLRLPPPRRVDPQVAGGAMLLAPLSVVPLGVAVTCLLLVTAETGVPPSTRGLLAVALLALGTRALHWDGLSDVADGLTAAYDRERSLAVMRTGTSGPAGTLAVVLVAGLQAAGFAALSGSSTGCVLAGACVLGSRVSLATCCARPVPPARPEGLGATVAGTVPVLAAALAWLALAGALAGLLAVLPVQRAPWHALVAVVLAAVVTLLLVRRCTSRLGGVTGDVLGAGVETSLAVLLLALA